MSNFWLMSFPMNGSSVATAFERAAEVGGLDVECRIVRADGEVRWIAAKGKVKRDGSGRAGPHGRYRDGHDRAEDHRGNASSSAEDGSHRPANRRRGARFQQPVDGHRRRSRHDDPPAGPAGPGDAARGSRHDRRAARRKAHATASGVLAAPDVEAGDPQSQSAFA